MTGHEITLSRRIEAPAEQVWDALTDLERGPERLSSVTRVEPMTNGPYALGTRWRETRKVLGKETTEEMWVAENDPLQRTVIQASSKGAAYRTVFTLEPLPPLEEATELTVTFGADTPEPTGLQKVAWTVLGPLGLRFTRKQLERDLADIAAAAERGA